MNKSEMNLMNKVLESGIEFKVELYKALETNIKEQLRVLNDIMGMTTTEIKPVETVKEIPATKDEPKETKTNNTVLGKDIKEQQIVLSYCGSCNKETKQYRKGGEVVCLECGDSWELFEEDEYEVTDKFHNEPKQAPKTNHKVSDVKKLIKCGPQEGEDAVLFVEKRKDNKHLWYGQIRLNNYIRNFHWSNELDMPVVYGVEGAASLKEARELIRNAVKEISPKELTMYDSVIDHPEFGGFSGRQYLGALHQGAYIYLTPEATDSDKDTDIIAKGYTNGHAFIVRRDQEVFWRNYNYIFSKKPFESTPSKGYDTETLVNNVGLLYDAVCEQFEKLSSAYYRKVATKNEATNNTNNSSKSAVEDATTADISSLY